MKKRATNGKKFRNTEIGALFEALRSEFKPVLEVIPDMKEKLDGTFEQVCIHTEKFVVIETAIKALDTSVKALETAVKALETAVKGNTERISALETTVGSLETAVETLDTTVKEHSERISGLETAVEKNRLLIMRILEELRSKVDREEFDILEKRVASLGR
jgi:chromosome segregation ATPase